METNDEKKARVTFEQPEKKQDVIGKFEYDLEAGTEKYYSGVDPCVCVDPLPDTGGTYCTRCRKSFALRNEPESAGQEQPPILKPVTYHPGTGNHLPYGRYLVVRKDGKTHLETYNGTGWAYNDNAISFYYLPKIS